MAASMVSRGAGIREGLASSRLESLQSPVGSRRPAFDAQP
jgi:hypothetical protein